MALNATIAAVTDRIRRRSNEERARYLERSDAARRDGPHRSRLSCGNLAHGFAACDAEGKSALKGVQRPNLAVVSAYNGML